MMENSMVNGYKFTILQEFIITYSITNNIPTWYIGIGLYLYILKKKILRVWCEKLKKK